MQFPARAAIAASALFLLAAQPPPPCSAPQQRQLDFWIGEWDVFNTADNVRYATSQIDRIVGGCGIRERYEAPAAPGGAYSGTSYSAWDRKDGKWHQMYVDTNGNVTWYSGGLVGAEMVLSAEGRDSSLLRMVYRPEADGSVRQVGTRSTDGGKNWKTGYDYTYRRK